MEDSKHWGSRGQRASIVQVRTRKPAEANGGEKQMSCLNMKTESESLYRGGFAMITWLIIDVSIVSLHICHEVKGPGAMILVF